MGVLSPPQILRKSPFYKLPFSGKGVHTLGVCPAKASSRGIYYVVAYVNLKPAHSILPHARLGQ
jgi:hypothetical protein